MKACVEASLIVSMKDFMEANEVSMRASVKTSVKASMNDVEASMEKISRKLARNVGSYYDGSLRFSSMEASAASTESQRLPQQFSVCTRRRGFHRTLAIVFHCFRVRVRVRVNSIQRVCQPHAGGFHRSFRASDCPSQKLSRKLPRDLFLKAFVEENYYSVHIFYGVLFIVYFHESFRGSKYTSTKTSVKASVKASLKIP